MPTFTRCRSLALPAVAFFYSPSGGGISRSCARHCPMGHRSGKGAGVRSETGPSGAGKAKRHCQDQPRRSWHRSGLLSPGATFPSPSASSRQSGVIADSCHPDGSASAAGAVWPRWLPTCTGRLNMTENTMTLSSEALMPVTGQPFNNKQRLFVRYFTGILIDLVVLNLFVEYSDKSSSSRSASRCWPPCCFKSAEGPIAVEHWVAASSKARQAVSTRSCGSSSRGSCCSVPSSSS